MGKRNSFTLCTAPFQRDDTSIDQMRSAYQPSAGWVLAVRMETEACIHCFGRHWEWTRRAMLSTGEFERHVARVIHLYIWNWSKLSGQAYLLVFLSLLVGEQTSMRNECDAVQQLALSIRETLCFLLPVPWNKSIGFNLLSTWPYVLSHFGSFIKVFIFFFSSFKFQKFADVIGSYSTNPIVGYSERESHRLTMRSNQAMYKIVYLFR